MRRGMTRRQRALLRLGVLVLALVLLGTVGGYGFTPESALRKSRAFYQMEDAQTVIDLGDLGLDLTPSRYVTYNGLWDNLAAKLGTSAVRAAVSADSDRVLLSACHFHWLTGWQPLGIGVVVSCTDGEPLHGGCWELFWFGGSWEEHYQSILCAVGRVDDPRVTQVEVRVEGEQTQFAAYSAGVVYTRVDIRQTIPLNGSRYFCARLGEDTGMIRIESVTLVGLDANGNEVTQAEGTPFIDFIRIDNY